MRSIEFLREGPGNDQPMSDAEYAAQRAQGEQNWNNTKGFVNRGIDAVSDFHKKNTERFNAKQAADAAANSPAGMAAAKANLTPSQLKWLGSAQPSPEILQRMPAPQQGETPAGAAYTQPATGLTTSGGNPVGSGTPGVNWGTGTGGGRDTGGSIPAAAQPAGTGLKGPKYGGLAAGLRPLDGSDDRRDDGQGLKLPSATTAAKPATPAATPAATPVPAVAPISRGDAHARQGGTNYREPVVSTPVAPPTTLTPVPVAPVAANSAAADAERDGSPDAINTLRKNAGLPPAFNAGKDSQQANYNRTAMGTALATEMRAIADDLTKLQSNTSSKISDIQPLVDRVNKLSADSKFADPDVATEVQRLTAQFNAQVKILQDKIANPPAQPNPPPAGQSGSGGAAWSYVLDGTDEGYAMSNGFVKDGRADLAAWRAAGSPGKPKVDPALPTGTNAGEHGNQDPSTRIPSDEKYPRPAAPSSWQSIYNLNKQVIGANPNLIKPGQQLKMPNGSTYTVKSGDTLSKIAAAPTPAATPAATQAPTPVPVPPMPNPNFRTGTMAQRDAWLAKYGKTHNMDGKPAQAMRESKFDESVNLMRRLSTMLKGRLI